MPSHDDSVNGSVNGVTPDKPPHLSESPRFGNSGGVEVTLTCQQFQPSAGGNNLELLPDTPFSSQSSSGISRELSFESERGPVTCPEFIGEYQVISLLGRGGMGNVFKVKNPFFNFEQALKMLDAKLDTKESRRQFIAEMRTQAELEHTNVAKVHYAGVCRARGKYHDQLYFVMALEAGDLGDEIKKRGPFPAVEAANIVRRLAKAIGLAHARGTYHCDLKPKNILLGVDGTPKITDFGLVKLLADRQDGRVGRTGAFGTPSYMPPEQADGDFDRVDARSDIYGLGAILYELLTGKPPYQGLNRNEILWQVKNEKTPPEPVRKLNPKVPAWLEAICLKCLEKNPDKRFSSAAELENQLDRLLRPKWWKRHWKTLATVAVVASLISAVATLGYRQYAHPRHEARDRAREGDAATTPVEQVEKYRESQKKYAAILDGEFILARSSLEAEAREVNRKLIEAEGRDWSARARERRLEAEERRREGHRDAAVDRLRILLLDYRERLNDEQLGPTVDEMEFAEMLTELAELQIERRDYTDAMKILAEAKSRLTGDDPKQKLARAEALHIEGVGFADQERWSEALDRYTAGLDLRLEVALPVDHPRYRKYLQNLARSHGYLGDAQMRKGLIAEARASYAEARVIRAKLAANGGIDEKCYHARDDGNFAELCEWQGSAELDRALEHRRNRVTFYATHMGDRPVLPGPYRTERADANLALVELLLDLPDLPGPRVHERFEESKRSLDAAEDEFLRLRKESGTTNIVPDLWAGLARVHLARARYELVRSRATFQPARSDDASRQLNLAEQFLNELDGEGKAQALDYYSWAALLALRGQLADSNTARTSCYVLALDRLTKALRMGYVKRERLRRDTAFAGLLLDRDLGPQLKDLIEKCACPQATSEKTP